MLVVLAAKRHCSVMSAHPAQALSVLWFKKRTEPEVSKYLSCLSFPVLSRLWRYIFISRLIYCPVSLSILLFYSLLSTFLFYV